MAALQLRPTRAETNGLAPDILARTQLGRDGGDPFGPHVPVGRAGVPFLFRRPLETLAFFRRAPLGIDGAAWLGVCSIAFLSSGKISGIQG